MTPQNRKQKECVLVHHAIYPTGLWRNVRIRTQSATSASTRLAAAAYPPTSTTVNVYSGSIYVPATWYYYVQLYM
jgi:hypothetical protein